MNAESPAPLIDPVAAARWRIRAPTQSPWLHEEVGRRMAERLGWIKARPRRWLDWQPAAGGRDTHHTLAQTYPEAQCLVSGPDPARALAALVGPMSRRWNPFARGPRERLPQAGEAVDLLWANMALHHESDPQGRLAQWQAAIQVDGFLMFSCFGPDTLKELRVLHQRHGWPEPTQAFVDMHDWGDLLVLTGFAEPVMDMERIVLTYSSADRLLAELRGLGRNLHPQRFPGLRGRAWAQRYRDTLAAELPRDADGRLCLTFEVIYGHAFKARPRLKPGESSAISLQDMRAMLRQPRT